MRNITFTEEQTKQLLEILANAKYDTREMIREFGRTQKEKKDAEEYCKEIDAIIALLKHPTNNQPPTPHTEKP